MQSIEAIEFAVSYVARKRIIYYIIYDVLFCGVQCVQLYIRNISL